MSINGLFSILLSEKPSILIKQNEEDIFKLIPELKRCKGFNQNNPWHPYDVYEHILHVVDNVDNDLILRLIALFHDIGKPEVYKEDEQGIGHFYNHWVISQKIFEQFAEEYIISNKETISKIIYYHDYSLDKLDEIKDIFNKEELKILFDIKRADLLAQSSKYHYILNEINNKESELIRGE